MAGACRTLVATVAVLAVVACAPPRGRAPAPSGIQLGPRPYYLVADLEEGALKSALEACAGGPFAASGFSIGHRGAPLHFPEHTAQSYRAAARMGAGRIECDATFTKDRALVCRHSQCDLHATTDILMKPELAAKCTQPFVPADPDAGTEASARCCTSDIILAEYKTLCGRMDGVDTEARTLEAYLAGTPAWRTDLYAGCGTVLSHAESIALIDRLGADFVPELKQPLVPMPFDGDYGRDAYRQQLIDEYRAAGIAPERVWPQSFDLRDVLYWIEHEPEFGRNAVLLDERVLADPGFAPTEQGMRALAGQGVRILAPPLWALLALDRDGRIVPSAYARAARAAGLDLVAWSLERSGPLADGGGWYYQSIAPAIRRDGDALVALDVLARDVGVIGVFSDWPATVTYYANCSVPEDVNGGDSR